MNNTYEILQELYNQKERNNLVVFVGAGISQFYAEFTDGGKGFPSWNELIDDLKEDINSDITDSLQVAQIYQDVHSKEGLVRKVKDIFPKNYKHSKLHELIFDLNPAHVLTTNYDNLLEQAIYQLELKDKYHIVDTDESIPFSKSKQNMLVKAHGDLCRGNIVLSEQDYSEYEQKFPLILSFIRYVFSKHKVVFIGFSLTDPNFNRILYWVKNILQENSVKHTVILHTDITSSERTYFESKNVQVVTQNQIATDILKKPIEEVSRTYLSEAIEFIKNGHPSLPYLNHDDMLKVLKDRLKHLKSFNYLLPSFIDNALTDSPLKLHYNPFVIDEEKRTRFSWIGLIDGRYGSTLNLMNILAGYDDIEFDKKFCELYFNDIVNIFLKSNIGSIGYSGGYNRQKILYPPFSEEYITSEHNKYMLTYEHSSESINDVDKSFESDSPFYNLLSLSDEGYYIEYLKGNKEAAYTKFMAIEYFDGYIEKYLHFFKRRYLYAGRKLQNAEDLNPRIYDRYKAIYTNATQEFQHILKPIHYLEFVQDFKEYLSRIEKDYKDYKKEYERGARSFGGFDKEDLYRFSFYVNYSRLLKFIVLNQLPVLHDEKLQQTIHHANMLYFQYFADFTKDNIDIPNWILFGLIIDKDHEELHDRIVDIHNEYYQHKKYFVFDLTYVSDLLSSMVKLDERSIVNSTNLLAVLSISSKQSNIFELFTKHFLTVMKEDIGNIDSISKHYYIAYLNFERHNNKTPKNIKKYLFDIVETYVVSKLEQKYETKKGNNSFAHFLFNLKHIQPKRNQNIINLTQSVNFDDFTCHNLYALLKALHLLGYKKKDISSFIGLVTEKLNSKEFYSKRNAIHCFNEIENAAIQVFKLWSVDCGIGKLEKHYLKVFKSNLKTTGYSGELSGAIEWFYFSIDNELKTKKFENIFNDKKLRKLLIAQLKYLLEQTHDTLFNSFIETSRAKMIVLLLKVGQEKIIQKSVEDATTFSTTNILKNILNNCRMLKKDRIRVVKFIKILNRKMPDVKHRSLIGAIKAADDNTNTQDLKSLLLRILSDTK